MTSKIYTSLSLFSEMIMCKKERKKERKGKEFLKPPLSMPSKGG
tara:strand:- start:485 stop:616 length:132 start_codon:yes stop_codon:yes gene_type:complete